MDDNLTETEEEVLSVLDSLVKKGKLVTLSNDDELEDDCEEVNEPDESETFIGRFPYFEAFNPNDMSEAKFALAQLASIFSYEGNNNVSQTLLDCANIIDKAEKELLAIDTMTQFGDNILNDIARQQSAKSEARSSSKGTTRTRSSSRKSTRSGTKRKATKRKSSKTS